MTANNRPRRHTAGYACIALLGCSAGAHATDVAMCTDFGRIEIRLFDDRAPRYVENFLQYADDGYYSGTVFHRVVGDFVVQGGGNDTSLRNKPTRPPVPNESDNGLSNLRGTLGAARTADPDSAAAQFFFNLADNAALDSSDGNPGYTVFGRVLEGMEVVDRIGALPTGSAGQFSEDVPDPVVEIDSVARIDPERLSGLPEDGRQQALRERVDDADSDTERLAWLTQYRTTCPTMTPELLLTEARTAAALERPNRARSALEEFFRTAGQNHPQYADARALYRETPPVGYGEPLPSVEDIAGHCTAPPAPTIPDGNTATLDEMVAAQGEVREFMTAGDEYLECLNEVLEDDELTEDERAIGVQAHNATVGLMESIANLFNEQVRIIQSRDEEQ